MIKVVINCCYGGFSLSKAAVEYMASRGNVEAHEMLGSGYGYWEGDRHDPILVEAVEKLGKEASGSCSDLCVVAIEGNKYLITEYDGNETVQTPESMPWIEVK